MYTQGRKQKMEVLIFILKVVIIIYIIIGIILTIGTLNELIKKENPNIVTLVMLVLLVGVFWPAPVIYTMLQEKQKNENKLIEEEEPKTEKAFWEEWAEEMRDPTEEEIEVFREIRKKKYIDVEIKEKEEN